MARFAMRLHSERNGNLDGAFGTAAPSGLCPPDKGPAGNFPSRRGTEEERAWEGSMTRACWVDASL